MRVPQNIKYVQKLIERLVALNRFILKSVERSIIFQALKGAKSNFTWGPSQQHVFEEIKRHLFKLTTLATPTPRG